MRTDLARPVLLSHYRPTDYLIKEVTLDFDLDDTKTRVVSRLHIEPNPAGVAGAALVLDGDGLTLVRATLDGQALPLALGTSDSFTLPNPPQRPFVLEFETSVNPCANTQLMGLYRSGSAFCTQCEAEGFRRITYFLDRPDVLSVYTTRIVADKAAVPVLLGNGNLVAQGDLEAGRHFAVWHDPFPKPCYLFALVGGALDVLRDRFVTQSGRNVELGIYVEPGKAERASYAMDALKRSMAWDELVFGREYDLDIFNIVAVSDFNMGAMENKGLNVFNDKYVLALPQTATDQDYAHIEAVIAHEYFHNWTGNRITCREWFQLCLKEGLTVFRDQEFSSDQRSRAVKRIQDVKNLRAVQFVEDAGPLAHNVRPDSYMEINNFYTSTIYEKGSEVVRMLKTLIGEQAFRAGMDRYFERYDGTAATMEDFIGCFAAVTGRDFGQFMRWYGQAGTPKLHVESQYDASARRLEVVLRQETAPTPKQPEKLPFVIPVRLGLVGKDSDLALVSSSASAEELASGVFELNSATRRLVFEAVETRPVVSVLRGFSAPVKVVFAQSDDDLLHLARSDSDSFNRWQALQDLALRVLKHGIATGAPCQHDGLLGAYARILEHALDDPAFAALALSLPSEADICREIGANVDPDAVRAARESLRRAMGQALLESCLDLHRQIAVPQPFSADAKSAGRRALNAVLLDLIVGSGSARGLLAAKAQFDSAETMTDILAALNALISHSGPEREAALADFYQRYQNEHLVVDKWFSVQAMIGETGTLERVQQLSAHPAFSFGNPNRVRSLIGAFALSNPTQFNRADGAGYRYVTECVAQLDRTNPQVAARLLSAFRAWRTFDAARQNQARAALESLAKYNTLSADVRDIVTRSLA